MTGILLKCTYKIISKSRSFIVPVMDKNVGTVS
jgi:hypothetical protein